MADMKSVMPWETLENALPFLLPLNYALVHCTLSILAGRRRNAVKTYDRFREAHIIRKQYLDSVKNRQINTKAVIARVGQKKQAA